MILPSAKIALASLLPSVCTFAFVILQIAALSGLHIFYYYKKGSEQKGMGSVEIVLDGRDPTLQYAYRYH